MTPEEEKELSELRKMVISELESKFNDARVKSYKSFDKFFIKEFGYMSYVHESMHNRFQVLTERFKSEVFEDKDLIYRHLKRRNIGSFWDRVMFLFFGKVKS